MDKEMLEHTEANITEALTELDGLFKKIMMEFNEKVLLNAKQRKISLFEDIDDGIKETVRLVKKSKSVLAFLYENIAYQNELIVDVMKERNKG